MTKRLDPKTFFSVSFSVALLVFVLLRNNGWRVPSGIDWTIFQTESAANPEDAIYAMLDAARTGNTESYLNAFSGPMHDQLRQVASESADSKFAEYLTAQNAAFQGVAVSVVDQPSDTEAQVRVEYVYSNRNEIQNFCLKKERSKW